MNRISRKLATALAMASMAVLAASGTSVAFAADNVAPRRSASAVAEVQPVAGLVGISSTPGGAGVYGENQATSGFGIFGYGDWGVLGRATAKGAGVAGQAANVAGSRGVVGTSSPVLGSVGVEAIGQPGNLALDVYGRARFDDRITVYKTADAPLVLPIVSVKPAPVVGGIALHSSYGLIVSDGTNWYAAATLAIVP